MTELKEVSFLNESLKNHKPLSDDLFPSLQERLSFSHNWNNKLQCRFHTTIRRHNPKKYFVGKQFMECLHSLPIATVIVCEVKTLTFQAMSEAMCSLDTGYCKRETGDILVKMYKDFDAEKTLFDWIVLNVIEVKNNF